jgi:sugar-specific transcriptional regulator TrmB
MNQKLKQLLIKAGLSERSTDLYLYVLEHKGCSVADAYLNLKYAKTSLYRAFEELKIQGLVKSATDDWKNSLEIVSLGALIKKLENEKRQTGKLINSLRAIELAGNLENPEILTNFEILNEENTYERYLDLAKSRDWDTMLVFGNWEDFNNENRSIVPIEKKFINERLKKGGKALVAVSKEGPSTWQIIDYNKNLDRNEDRRSIKLDDIAQKPLWVNVFEGNDYLHIWNLNSRGKIVSTFMECKPVADFYKDFIYTKLI